MDLELKGKVAIVTGGSRGIGKAAAADGAMMRIVTIIWDVRYDYAGGAAMRTIGRSIVSLDGLPESIRHLTQDPIPAEVLERRRKLSVEARKVRDEMEPLDEDVKDIIREQRGENPIG